MQRSTSLLAAAALLMSVVSAKAAERPKPDILWICADDLAPYAIGVYGNKQVRTPNLDRLAAQGMRFDRAYCNSPVCTASRQSFLTGRYPRAIGVTRLQTPLPESELTAAELLKQAGYDTAAIGKMHFNSPLKHGFDLRLDLPDHATWLERKGRLPLPEGIQVQKTPWRPFQDPARVWLNADARPWPSADADMAGTFFAREAANYLRERREKPFFLMVSFYEPHSPFHFPIEFGERHTPSEFKVPAPGPEDDRQIPRVFRDLTGPEKQGIIAAYHASVEFLDRNVGIVLNTLSRSGKARDTLVIFTGDHGYMLGQHGRFEKHCGFEPAVRAPLFVRYPGRIRAGESSEALVELIDLVPTILDYAGVTTPDNIQGRTLAALLNGSTKGHRDRVFIEYSENAEAYLVAERWKFIYGTGRRLREDGYETGRALPGRTVQLFDLKVDPEELRNLAERPEYTQLVADFTTELADHMKRTSREPQLIPKTDDVHAVLDFCLQPRDLIPR